MFYSNKHSAVWTLKWIKPLWPAQRCRYPPHFQQWERRSTTNIKTRPQLWELSACLCHCEGCGSDGGRYAASLSFYKNDAAVIVLVRCCSAEVTPVQVVSSCLRRGLGVLQGAKPSFLKPECGVVLWKHETGHVKSMWMHSVSTIMIFNDWWDINLLHGLLWHGETKHSCLCEIHPSLVVNLLDWFSHPPHVGVAALQPSFEPHHALKSFAFLYRAVL